MNKKTKIRAYQNRSVEDSLYQFEMGNELGAQLEKDKELHELSYEKKTNNQHEVDEKENSSNKEAVTK